MNFAYALGAIAIFYNVEKSIPLFISVVKYNRMDSGMTGLSGWN